MEKRPQNEMETLVYFMLWLSLGDIRRMENHVEITV